MAIVFARRTFGRVGLGVGTMRVECIHPNELDATLIGEWRHLRAQSPAYTSPYFHPRFAQLVGLLRDDARVLVLSDGGRRVGFWALHKRPDGFARPLGQPLADENGPILAPDAQLDLSKALRAARIGAAAFTGAPAHLAAIRGRVTEIGESARINLSLGGAATLAALKARHTTHFKTMRRKERKAVEAFDHIGFDARSRDRGVLTQLIAWKRAQFTRTGLYDVFAPRWTQDLISLLAAEDAADFRGVLTVLRFAGEVAAAEFSLQSDGHLHSWITAYDASYAAHSPGHLLQMRMIEGADEAGVALIDIGVGADHYKCFYANATEPLAQGIMVASTLAGAAHDLRGRLWRAVETAPVGTVSKAFTRLRRRTEIIVSADQSLEGRMRGLWQAVAAAAERSGGARHATQSAG